MRRYSGAPVSTQEQGSPTTLPLSLPLFSLLLPIDGRLHSACLHTPLYYIGMSSLPSSLALSWSLELYVYGGHLLLCLLWSAVVYAYCEVAAKRGQGLKGSLSHEQTDGASVVQNRHRQAYGEARAFVGQETEDRGDDLQGVDGEEDSVRPTDAAVLPSPAFFSDRVALPSVPSSGRLDRLRVVYIVGYLLNMAGRLVAGPLHVPFVPSLRVLGFGHRCSVHCGLRLVRLAGLLLRIPGGCVGKEELDVAVLRAVHRVLPHQTLAGVLDADGRQSAGRHRHLHTVLRIRQLPHHCSQARGATGGAVPAAPHS